MERKSKAQIWAVGGGKGGTGKSFIASSLGTCLASKGHRVILLDADLGGANLHSFLGIRRPKKGLTDFFDRKMPLNELVVPCGIEGLGLVAGDIGSLDSDAIKYTQKLKLFRHIAALDADYVIVDLGSGSHNNTLDTFLLADRMIAVIVPEITAVENMYHFIKNAFFRKLKMTLGAHGLKDNVQEIWRNRENYKIKNLMGLVEYIQQTMPEVRDVLEGELNNFKVDLVLNKIKSNKEVAVGTSVKSVFTKYLGFEARYAGYVEHDDSVWRCTEGSQPFMLTYPFSYCAREVEKISENLRAESQIQVVDV